MLETISFYIGIVSFILGIVFFYASQKSKEPVYNVRNFSLIDKKYISIPNIEITATGESIDHLTLTYFSLWNLGSDIINSSDVALSNPIKLTLPSNKKILTINIDHVKNPSNNFKLTISDDRQSVNICFDYFAKNEGIVMSLYHTGLLDDISLQGTIKGISKIENYSQFSSYHGGAMLSHRIYKSLGGKKSRLWGITLIVVLFPLWFYLMIFGQYAAFQKLIVDDKFLLNS